MLGTVATVAIVTIEVAMVTYQMNKAGVFDRFKKTTRQVRDTVLQPKLKELSWKS